MKYFKIIALVILIISAVGLAVHLHTNFSSYNTTQEDIYSLYADGNLLVSGQNPYARILSGNMRENQKYPTYFPLFYLLSALTQWAGLEDFTRWLSFWRVVFLVFNLGIAAAIFIPLYRRGQTLLAVFAGLFWLFNRWTVQVSRIAQIDFLPVFFLVGSLLLFPKRQRASLLLFSLSLAVKQIAVFLAPLYLVWVWQSSGKKPFREVIAATAVIASIPALVSLPFIFWNAEGLVRSIFFSATRNPGGFLGSGLSVDQHLGLLGVPARLPMLGLMALVYILAIQRRIGRFLSVLLTMSTFAYFSNVLFQQYLIWPIPFIPLVMLDLDSDRGPPQSSK